MNSQRSFPPTPASVHEARLFVLSELSQLDETRLEQISLIVSELATNAVIHAATPFTVSLTLSAASLTIEVTDQGLNKPTPASVPPPPEQLHGRGLLIITRLATDWGITPHSEHNGKAVWVKLTLDPETVSPASNKESFGVPFTAIMARTIGPAQPDQCRGAPLGSEPE